MYILWVATCTFRMHVSWRCGKNKNNRQSSWRCNTRTLCIHIWFYVWMCVCILGCRPCTSSLLHICIHTYMHCCNKALTPNCLAMLASIAGVSAANLSERQKKTRMKNLNKLPSQAKFHGGVSPLSAAHTCNICLLWLVRAHFSFPKNFLFHFFTIPLQAEHLSVYMCAFFLALWLGWRRQKYAIAGASAILTGL